MVAQWVQNPPVMEESWDQSLDPEDPLKKEMATHFSVLTWEIRQTEEPGGLQSMVATRVKHALMTKPL